MTESSADRLVVMDAVRAVATPFLAEGHERLYVALCCKRMLVIPHEVGKCRTCGKKPHGFWVTKEEIGA